MAILSAVPPPSQQDPNVPLTAIAGGFSNLTLRIPLSENAEAAARPLHKKKSIDLKRDTLRRRDLLLKGKEGSRRRQRWDNANFLNVPNAQAPLPSDWEVRPTYPVHTVPYYLAPLWDAGVRHRAEEKLQEKQQKKQKLRSGATGTTGKDGKEITKGKVPQELRTKMKRSKGAKTLLQDLESEIRTFIREYEEKEQRGGAGGGEKEVDFDSEDEEIVFIGRDNNGHGITMSDEQKEVVEEELMREKKVYEGLVGEKEGGFARWLVHCLGEYYGLSSRSETVGAKRRAWVGIREREEKEREVLVDVGMPMPLWGLV